MKAEKLDKEIDVVINIKQGYEIKIFSCVYLDIKIMFYVCEKLTFLN
jgi:hypothetical protein